MLYAPRIASDHTHTHTHAIEHSRLLEVALCRWASTDRRFEGFQCLYHEGQAWNYSPDVTALLATLL